MGYISIEEYKEMHNETKDTLEYQYTLAKIAGKAVEQNNILVKMMELYMIESDDPRVKTKIVGVDDEGQRISINPKDSKYWGKRDYRRGTGSLNPESLCFDIRAESFSAHVGGFKVDMEFYGRQYVKNVPEYDIKISVKEQNEIRMCEKMEMAIKEAGKKLNEKQTEQLHEGLRLGLYKIICASVPANISYQGKPEIAYALCIPNEDETCSVKLVFDKEALVRYKLSYEEIKTKLCEKIESSLSVDVGMEIIN